MNHLFLSDQEGALQNRTQSKGILPFLLGAKQTWVQIYDCRWWREAAGSASPRESRDSIQEHTQRNPSYEFWPRHKYPPPGAWGLRCSGDYFTERQPIMIWEERGTPEEPSLWESPLPAQGQRAGELGLRPKSSVLFCFCFFFASTWPMHLLIHWFIHSFNRHFQGLSRFTVQWGRQTHKWQWQCGCVLNACHTKRKNLGSWVVM